MLKIVIGLLGGNIMDNSTANTTPSKGLTGSFRSLLNRNRIAGDEEAAATRESEDYLKSVNEAEMDLENVERLFDNALDPDLIEYAIYEEYAIKLKLSYLIKKAKEKEIKSEVLTSIADRL